MVPISHTVKSGPLFSAANLLTMQWPFKLHLYKNMWDFKGQKIHYVGFICFHDMKSNLLHSLKFKFPNKFDLLKGKIFVVKVDLITQLIYSRSVCMVCG